MHRFGYIFYRGLVSGNLLGRDFKRTNVCVPRSASNVTYLVRPRDLTLSRFVVHSLCSAHFVSSRSLDKPCTANCNTVRSLGYSMYVLLEALVSRVARDSLATQNFEEGGLEVGLKRNKDVNRYK